MAKYTAIGGQALIEGIMMKSPEKTALAVRTPDQSIDVTYLDGKSVRERFSVLRVPVIRGVATFIESMVQGYHAMMLSAEKSGYTDLDEEEKPSGEKDGTASAGNAAQEQPAEAEAETEVEVKAETEAEAEAENETAVEPEAPAENHAEKAGEKKPVAKRKEAALISAVMVLGTVLGVALAVILFMLLPRLAVSGLRILFHTEFSQVMRASIEQLIKLVIFVVYIWLVAFMKDIRRVFMYHGAEHKTIFCYEKGLPLTVENVRKQRRFHPRCGTSFMILMILVSIIFSTLIQMIFPGVYEILWLWVIVKILLVPLVCGAGYELLRACGRHDNILTRIISAPGLWMQRITTKEPDDGMIEVAITALRACEPETPDVDRSVDQTNTQGAQAG